MAELLRGIDSLRATAGGSTTASGYLGVGLDRRNDGGSGALVTQVEAGSPADDAGLSIDDVIVEIDGVTVAGEAGLIAIIRDRVPGSTVQLGVVRNGERVDLAATLVERTTG